MIHSVTVTNHLGESLELILTQPELSGLIVKSIDGMGPSDTTVNITELVTMDGGIVNSARLNSKEIKLDLIFMEKPTIEDTRLLTYKYFPIKKPVSLTFKTIRPGNIEKTATIYGVVEKNEPKIFQKQESATITIKCADPYFHSESTNSKMFFGAEPLFEFEWSNEIDANPPYEYYDIDTYGEDGIIDSDRIVYQEDEDHSTTEHIDYYTSDDGYFDIFEGMDKIDIRIVSDWNLPWKTDDTGTEKFKGSVTRVLDDPDPNVMVIPENAHNILLYGSNDVNDTFNLYVSRDENGNIVFRYLARTSRLWDFYIYLTAYTAHGKSTTKVIYYDPTYDGIHENKIEDLNIPVNNTRTYICKYPKVDITFEPNYGGRRVVFNGSITMINEDPDPNVIKIADGTVDRKIYYEASGQVLVSRSGDTFTIKVTAYPTSQGGDVTLIQNMVYKRYKNVFFTELGILNTITEGNIWYEGDGDTGFIIDVIYKGLASGIQFIDKETGERIRINETKLRERVGSVQYGDIFRINTIRGQKSAKYIRENSKQEWDVLDCLVAPIQWLKLVNGKNVFGYAAETGLDKLVFDIKYDVLYGGI